MPSTRCTCPAWQGRCWCPLPLQPYEGLAGVVFAVFLLSISISMAPKGLRGPWLSATVAMGRGTMPKSSWMSGLGEQTEFVGEQCLLRRNVMLFFFPLFFFLLLNRSWRLGKAVP